MRELWKCPRCGRRARPDAWDVIGACDDNVFCQLCHTEFDPATGRIHRCNKTAERASIDRERGLRCLEE